MITALLNPNATVAYIDYSEQAESAAKVLTGQLLMDGKSEAQQLHDFMALPKNANRFVVLYADNMERSARKAKARKGTQVHQREMLA